MNILLAASKYMPEYSGAGYRAHNLYRRLISKRPDIRLSILCGSETESGCGSYEYDGFSVERISCKRSSSAVSRLSDRWRNFRGFYAENAAVKKFFPRIENKPDLIHVFGQNYVTVSAIDHAVKNKIPLLVELVTDLQSPFYYVPFPFRHWISSRPEKNFIFVCISEKLGKMCLAHGLAEKDVWCRPNPVDEARFKPVPPERKLELRKKLSRFSESDKVVCYIAKYRPSKNQDFLLEVMKELPAEYKLFLKGPLVESGPLLGRDMKFFDSLKEKAAAYGLESRVQIESGFCEEIEKYYQMSDVYAFPSTQEGLGTPVLESVACGVPVVANRIPSVTDVFLRDGENGFLSSSESAEDFSKSIMKASAFTPAKMKEESGRMIGLAGTDAIDAKYLSIMDKLAL